MWIDSTKTALAGFQLKELDSETGWLETNMPGKGTSFAEGGDQGKKLIE